MKHICFRFDIDTHVCISKGVPGILDLFSNYGKCTFFVSMGRGFSRQILVKESIENIFKKKEFKGGIYSMLSKLGVKESLRAILANPLIGLSHSQILHTINLQGHELGLHGGKNHAQWEHNALGWSDDELESEIKYGLMGFKKLNLPKPVSFASPCWQSPKKLSTILSSHDFLVMADKHKVFSLPSVDASGIINYPVNIVAKQPDVGFIENMRALGFTSSEILEEFDRQLIEGGNHQVVFDHPLYAGVKEIELLSAMLEKCKQRGCKIESIKNTLKYLNF